MKIILLIFVCLLSISSFAFAGTDYIIETAHNDEIFTINGEKYEAKTYCFGFEEGDRVVFIKGNEYGTCITATILNLRTNEECELWCE